MSDTRPRGETVRATPLPTSGSLGVRILRVFGRLLLFLLPIAILAGVGWLFLRMQMHRTKTDSDYAREKGEPLPVRVFSVEVAPLSRDVPTECTAAPNPLVEVRARITNRPVAKTYKAVGDFVQRNDLLLTLADQPERADVAAAKTMIEAYDDLVDSTSDLVAYFQTVRNERLGFEKELRSARVELARAQAELARAKANLAVGETALSGTRVTAPRDALVLEISQPGEASLIGDPLATLAGVDPILLECWIPEEKFAFVELGRAVEVTFFARPGRTHLGRVTSFDAYTKEKERLVLVRAELENPEHEILPGLHGIAAIKNEASVVRIPSIALIQARSDFAQVFTVDEAQRAWLRKITVGVASGGYSEVTSGLVAGERVVVAGQIGLQDGDHVRIDGAETLPADAATAP